MNKFRTIFSFILILLLFLSCSLIKNILPGDRLYFIEKYSNDKEVGESKKFPSGPVTIMVRLSKPIGVSSVDINITDQSNGAVVETYPFTVSSDWKDIHFDDVSFRQTGKFKVSCLKKDGTVIASGEVEIENP
jgi:hypothetical protein